MVPQGGCGVNEINMLLLRLFAHKSQTSTSRWTTHKSSSTTFDTRNDYNSNLSITVSLHHTNSQHDGRVSPFIAKVAHIGSQPTLPWALLSGCF
ncbi:hypothetical protein Smp_113610 [Schistosoma mansoni]|uniref:Secreted protein n=1 Tax=Schistosoma mansoni TaxID=6183 RepID=G4VBT3_SCHMA|nr:hypothetical protein Smp_113610 [Schistosoma mansoni]|eukprot:XP_018649981.1 hypothetical protein Smp_113610 [Schistosoma mansoni]